MTVKDKYHVIGLMSGSSLDGLDMCCVEFIVHETVDRGPWTVDFKILHADCIEYDNTFRTTLKNLASSNAFDFAKTHTEVGKYFGRLTQEFIVKNNLLEIDLIASHGQTIFHQPNLGFTSQIGCGAQIAAQTNCKVVSDFRSSDVANGGQGAPIVPIAEKYLFPEYKVFLNLGGIANISFHDSVSTAQSRLNTKNESENKIIAYDICAANTMLDYLAQQKGMNYDKDGNLARRGNIIPSLLDKLNNIEFCKQAPPKSLGTEHVYNDWIALLDKYENITEDKLATAVEHIAAQIAKEINSKFNIQHSTLLTTGGGAFNSFLIDRIQHHSSLKITVPDQLTVQYKEALALAFIGLLRILEIPNCLASVTSAKKDVISGALYLP
ncbi:MAG: anhydro-N-acetylmuramic acid kinase [Bacteroidota bacterium]|nr:anhydro-N-acetylmuramic acid kinase [Bacteroidota bacterium]